MICSDINRECEFGKIITEYNIKEEKIRVVDKTIGFDDICHYEATGRKIKTISEYQVCKYCGNKKYINVKTEYI
jgi:hypothetical protein